MGFLVITCIGPSSKFLGLLSLELSMVIMAAIICAIAGYTYYEATVYFEGKTKFFGLVDEVIYLIIELGVALLLFVAYVVKKKCYSRLMYIITFAHAGFGLSFNIHKLSILKLEEGIKGDDKIFIKWLFFIRIGAEFLTELMVCYMVYSLKKKE